MDKTTEDLISEAGNRLADFIERKENQPQSMQELVDEIKEWMATHPDDVPYVMAGILQQMSNIPDRYLQ